MIIQVQVGIREANGDYRTEIIGDYEFVALPNVGMTVLLTVKRPGTIAPIGTKIYGNVSDAPGPILYVEPENSIAGMIVLDNTKPMTGG